VALVSRAHEAQVIRSGSGSDADPIGDHSRAGGKPGLDTNEARIVVGIVAVEEEKVHGSLRLPDDLAGVANAGFDEFRHLYWLGSD